MKYLRSFLLGCAGILFGCISSDISTHSECNFIKRVQEPDIPGIFKVHEVTANYACDAYQMKYITFITNVPVGFINYRNPTNQNWTTWMVLNGRRINPSVVRGLVTGITFPVPQEPITVNPESISTPSWCDRTTYKTYRVFAGFLFDRSASNGSNQIFLPLNEGQIIKLKLDVCENFREDCVSSEEVSLRVEIERDSVLHGCDRGRNPGDFFIDLGSY